MAVDELERSPAGDIVAIVGQHRVPIPGSIPPQVSPDGRAHVCFREDPDLHIDIPVCVFLPVEG